jgi:hypothetical protein
MVVETSNPTNLPNLLRGNLFKLINVTFNPSSPKEAYI